MMRPALLALAALLSAAPAAAQEAVSDTTRATPRLTATPGATAAGRELLQLMNVERVMQAGIVSTFDSMLQGQPAMAQFRDVMLAWANKYMTWAAVGDDFVRIYTDTFTESELREMIAFYKTPVGRKLAEQTPELTKRGAQIGAAVAARHSAELQQMVQARMAELQAEGKAP